MRVGEFASHGTRYEQGDINDDGQVDFSDLMVLSDNYGKRAVGNEPALVSAKVSAKVADRTSGRVFQADAILTIQNAAPSIEHVDPPSHRSASRSK